MPIKPDPKSVLLDHSQAKVKLLEEYLNRFLNIISNDSKTDRIYLFDVFCGEGLYDNGGEGSPLVSLRVLKNLHYVNKAKNNRIPPVDVHFNDIKAEKIEKLRKAISDKHLHYEEFGQLTYTTEDYKALLPRLVRQIQGFGQQKAFVFIDPYGYKEIRASDIKNLLATKKTEVLLFLPTQFMYRFDNAGTPEALIEILDELVEYENWKPSTSATSFVKQFTEGLRQFLGPEFFVDTFLVQKDPQTLFCLFFFSSHIRGFEKMLEAKWKLDEDRGEGFRYHKTMDLFSAGSGILHPLEAKLIRYLREERRYNGDVYEFVLHNGFLPSHASDVLGELQVQGRLDVFTAEGVKARKGAFYVPYDNYKKEPKKVFYILR